jgi:hypothetical protein
MKIILFLKIFNFNTKEMKKIFLIALFVCGMQIQAQKTFKLINLTASSVVIEDLQTSNTISGAYPRFATKPYGFITVAPFGSYTLVNTGSATKFPFNSPSSSPVITTWERTSAPGSSTLVTSFGAWYVGDTQVFYKIKVTQGGSSKNIGIASAGLQPSPITSNGWSVSYVQNGTVAAPIYTVTIY